jgi:hypothetical protein
MLQIYGINQLETMINVMFAKIIENKLHKKAVTPKDYRPNQIKTL